MRSLKDFVEDFVATTPIYTTPMNTPGMGNISIVQQPSQIGSGELFTDPICATSKPAKRKKKKSIKDFL